ncbi:endonuclease/exonuclease/phosphatase family metal-dependent hydrolase [Haloferula luteola]|uniref:Endonuclease/exonuclease/phosphatase family metal-dependent hydrolase n=1 Tax=Haloferula luteola TaxID=595692 RepID=A0A840VH75_9BACT|nr:endonuclease/exonuclease/phosphatase family metal-dependent hydrolase [Haloferula luteola]
MALASLPVSAETLGTYNIRYDNPGDRESGHAWAQRAPHVAGLIRFHDFDIVATQEGFKHQIDDLRRLLPDHAVSSHGRDDGADQGEQIAIFFRKTDYRLLDEGYFWLSETPEKPSRGWDADLFRMCGWVKLEPTDGRPPFYVFSIHFDHRGEESRKQSARLVLRKIDEIAGETTAYLMGDFNADQSSEAYRILCESSRFADAFELAKIRYAPNGTINGFDPNLLTESRIDHVFVPENAPVRRLGILTDTYHTPITADPTETTSANFPEEVKFGEGFATQLPSDHFPVIIELGNDPGT